MSRRIGKPEVNEPLVSWALLLILWAASIPAAFSPAATAAESAPSKAVATAYGAAGRVSGSLAVLDTGSARWMIDCGACYPEDEDTAADREDRAARESAALPVDATTVTALLVTHAHLDHIGRVPLLLDRGFQGPIYLTAGTAAIAEPMLEMQVRFDRHRRRAWSWSRASREKSQAGGRSLYVHWRPCSYRQEIAEGNLETATCSSAELAERFLAGEPKVKSYLCPSCAKDEVAAIRARFHPLDYGKPTEIGPGVSVEFFDAGHIPGSASIRLELSVAGVKRRVLFSGDLGNGLSALFAGPGPAPDADAVFVETTYGAVCRDPAVGAERAALRRAVAEVIRAGGVVWIPAFTLDRTQKVLYELHLAQKEGLLPETVPIYCPSPTAAAVTDLYRRHQQDGWFRPEVAGDPLAWQPREIRKSVPSNLPRPSILISPSDLATAAWSEKQLAKLLPEPSTSVLLVGYQDPLSEGGLLQRGTTQLDVLGQQVPVRAQIRSFHCFSGHGDAADVDRWLANVRRDALLILVHGGGEELASRAAQLKDRGWGKVRVARPGEAIDLTADP